MFRLIFFIPFFLSCSELTGDNTGANDLLGGSKIGDVFFSETQESSFLLEGTMDKGGRSSHNFRLRFSLEEAESLSFFFYASRSFVGGLEAIFSRRDSKVFAQFALNGINHEVELDEFGEGEIDLSLDVHNDHEDAHILLWKGEGPFEDAEECVATKGCLYNTEFYTFPNPGPWGTQGRGSGTFWGFRGDKDSIIGLGGPFKALSDA